MNTFKILQLAVIHQFSKSHQWLKEKQQIQIVENFINLIKSIELLTCSYTLKLDCEWVPALLHAEKSSET